MIKMYLTLFMIYDQLDIAVMGQTRAKAHEDTTKGVCVHIHGFVAHCLWNF